MCDAGLRHSRYRGETARFRPRAALHSSLSQHSPASFSDMMSLNLVDVFWFCGFFLICLFARLLVSFCDALICEGTSPGGDEGMIDRVKECM